MGGGVTLGGAILATEQLLAAWRAICTDGAVPEAPRVAVSRDEAMHAGDVTSGDLLTVVCRGALSRARSHGRTVAVRTPQCSVRRRSLTPLPRSPTPPLRPLRGAPAKPAPLQERPCVFQRKLKSLQGTSSPAFAARATRLHRRFRGELWHAAPRPTRFGAHSRRASVVRAVCALHCRILDHRLSASVRSSSSTSRRCRGWSRQTTSTRRTARSRLSCAGATWRVCASFDSRTLGGAPQRTTQSWRRCSTPSAWRRSWPNPSTAAT